MEFTTVSSSGYKNSFIFMPNLYIMKIKTIWFTLLAVIISLASCSREEDRSTIQEIIKDVTNDFAPDKRIALFDIQFENGQLKGETNLPKALESLKERLAANSVSFEDEVKVLPDESLEGKHFAVVTLSVANIRSQPRHSAELSTQATLGTPLKVWKKENSWYLIQTPDQYISWVDAAGIELMDEQEIEAWHRSEKMIYTDQVGYVYDTPDEELPVSDLVAGNILELLHEERNHYQVELPDGREGFVRKDEMEPFDEWSQSREISAHNLISAAKNMMGAPYLWGGTSIKGMDCSGFTKTIFFLHGKIIPRDASQQIREGEEVDTEKNWENLEVGDLLFFGVPASDTSSERVVHVGMWIGNNSFIHSRGRVRISSFDPASPDYDEYELNRYLRTKRIVGKESENVIGVNEIIRQ